MKKSQEIAAENGRRFGPLIRGFLAPGKGVQMVSHIELLTLCLVAIGVAGLAIQIIDLIMRSKRK